jgi:hypothetical protein
MEDWLRFADGHYNPAKAANVISKTQAGIA